MQQTQNSAYIIDGAALCVGARDHGSNTLVHGVVKQGWRWREFDPRKSSLARRGEGQIEKRATESWSQNSHTSSSAGGTKVTRRENSAAERSVKSKYRDNSSVVNTRIVLVAGGGYDSHSQGLNLQNGLCRSETHLSPFFGFVTALTLPPPPILKGAHRNEGMQALHLTDWARNSAFNVQPCEATSTDL